MCPPEYIRIDFFVTRATKSLHPPSALNTPLHSPELPLEPPSARRHQRHDSDAESDLSEEDDVHVKARKTKTVSVAPHADEAMDYVLFDGEHQDQSIAEMQWSRRVQQEGKLRRARSRKAFTGKRSRPARFQKDARLETAHEYGNEKDPFDNLTSDLIDQYSADLDDSRYADADSIDLGTPLPFYEKEHKRRGSEASHSPVQHQRPNHISLMTENPDFREDDVALDVSVSEMEDLHIISELARVGHPDIKEALREEQERSAGKTIVACCGPVALNINVRNLVASAIQPWRVARGDQRGQVALTVEDFE